MNKLVGFFFTFGGAPVCSAAVSQAVHNGYNDWIMLGWLLVIGVVISLLGIGILSGKLDTNEEWC